MLSLLRRTHPALSLKPPLDCWLALLAQRATFPDLAIAGEDAGGDGGSRPGRAPEGKRGLATARLVPHARQEC